MNQNKDLGELFRQQTYHTQELPRPNVWKRLQRRLDSYDRWHKMSQRISMHMVLVLLLLIAFVGPTLIFISIEQQKQAELRNPPVILQILSPNDTLPETRKFLQLHTGQPGDTILFEWKN